MMRLINFYPKVFIIIVLHIGLSISIYGQVEHKLVVKPILNRFVEGDLLLNEEVSCTNQYILSPTDLKQNIYTSPDRFLRFSFQLKDSSVNVFRDTKCATFIGDFKKSYRISSNEIIIEQGNRVSFDPEDYFSKKLKSITSIKREKNDHQFQIEIFDDNLKSNSSVKKIIFYKKYWIYIGRKRRELNYDDFLRLYGDKDAFISYIQFDFDGLHHINSYKKVQIRKGVNCKKRNLVVNFTDRNTKLVLKDSSLYLHTWSFEDQDYIRQFEMKYECVNSIYWDR